MRLFIIEMVNIIEDQLEIRQQIVSIIIPCLLLTTVDHYVACNLTVYCWKYYAIRMFLPASAFVFVLCLLYTVPEHILWNLHWVAHQQNYLPEVHRVKINSCHDDHCDKCVDQWHGHPFSYHCMALAPHTSYVKICSAQYIKLSSKCL